MANKEEDLVENERPEESLHYLLLSGLIDGTTADGVETYLSVLFEDDKVNSVVMLGGGTARAEVMADNESIQESLKKKHKIKKQPIEMTLTDPPDPSTSITDDHQSVSDVPALDYYPDLIEVTFDTDIDTDTLQLYFESKRSGGNRAKEVESIKTIEQGVVHVKFESSEDAAAVISQEKHSLMKNKKSLVVRYVPLPPVKEYDKSKLLIKDIPKEADEDLFCLFVEKCLGLDHETDFTFDLRSGIAVLFFGSSYTDEDLDEMATKLSAKKLKKQQLTVERCEVNYSVYVSGITNDTLATEDGLQMYFENPSRSGAGDDVLEKVEILAKGKAKVTFNDCSVIQRVLAKKHEKLGPDVSIRECSVLDSLEVSSDNDYESTEEAEEEEVVVKEKPSNKRDNKTGEKSSEELIKSKRRKKKQEDSNSDDDDDDTSSTFKDMPPLETAPAIPMNPIPHPLDPLLAKYVRLKPDVTKGIEREYQVTITAADVGIITISPTPTSPPDWPEKAIEMMHDVISSSLTKIDMPVPPEVSGTVYPMVMKACNDEGLQYAFGQGSNKVAIAGHVDAVMKLQHDVNEMCSRVIQTTGDVKLSHEDYIYFKSYSLSRIQQMYRAVKLQCHDDHLSVSVNGSIKDVDEVKAQLPQYLRHIKVPVNLQPDAITFLHNDAAGKKELASFVKSFPNVISYFSFDDQLVLFLLCPEEFASEAESVAMNIQQDITVQPIDLPQSFSRRVNDLKFASFKTKLSEKYPFSASIQQNKLVLVSTRNSIADVSKEFQAFISELCSITDTISFKKGVWRLIHSTSMEKKWSDLQEEIRKKGVTIVSSSKPAARKPYITVKGEEHNVEYAKKEILELQAAVKERQITISRPGICQYFMSNVQGQTILRGIESEAKVCIEVEVNKEDTGNFEQSVTPNSKFKKVGFGTTAEIKTVNVIVGDITEFKADVIVNAANDRLAHASGIAGDISRKGGPTIEEESRKYIERKGSLSDGDAVLFQKAGNLPYKAIVHAVGPRWSSYGSNKKETALLKRAVRKSLEKSKHYSSIAIPAISSGIFGFPVDVCANAILEAIIEFSDAESDAILDEINIVIFQDNVNEFLKAAEKHLENFQCSSSSKSATSSLVPSTPPTPTVDDSSSEKRRKIRGSSSSASSKVSLTCKPPIKISNGSIIDFQEEVLVNTTDTDLSFGGFVAKALLKASGPGLQQECANVAKPVNVGSVTATGGHNLESKHVLHVVLPGYDGPGGSAEKVLRQVVYDCLEECTRLKMKSISMPSIGAGNLKYPNNVVAKALMEETALFFQKNQGKTSLQLVHFVIFDREIYNEFQLVHKNLLSPISSDATPSDPVTPPSSSRSSSRSQQQHSTPRKAAYFGDSACSFPLPHNLCLELLQGDISCDDSDAVVNTTQENLKLLGQGVSGALLKKGGQALQDACDEAVAMGQRATEGKVVSTIATGSLKCKEVFHIAFHRGRNLTKTVQCCLELAEKKRFRSISFPAIGTGVHSYPAAKAAKAIADALKKFIASKPKHVKVIRMIVYQPHVHKEFVTAFNSIGESSEGLWNYLCSGVKAVKSFFTSSNSDDEMEVQPDEDAMEMDEEFEDLGEDVDAMHLNLSMDSEAILYIYGETDQTVGRAAKRIQSAIDTAFVSDEIDDASIAEFTSETISELKLFSLDRSVDIDIDCDEVLHLVKLHGCLQDVLLVKDKVRDAISFINQERSKKAATDAISKTVCWIRLNSQEQEEEYGEELNYYIETAYKNKEKSFDAAKEQFSIDFGTMEEKDMVTKAVVKVKRLDLTKVQEEQPKDWVPMPLDSKGQEKYSHLVSLTVSSAEFKNVEANFNQTMTGKYTKIVSIQRLQVPVLYQQYAVRKREIEKRNPKGHQNERWLWHGTSPDTLAKINTARGFDRNFAGKNATVYGKGVYFARDASYSHRYTALDANSQRHMYYAQVLTGEYTVGNTSMLAPPAKNLQVDANVLFDSTVDNVSNPTIFVVYQDTQCYPAYLITYQ